MVRKNKLRGIFVRIVLKLYFGFNAQFSPSFILHINKGNGVAPIFGLPELI